jgi:hypothetical protein
MPWGGRALVSHGGMGKNDRGQEPDQFINEREDGNVPRSRYWLLSALLLLIGLSAPITAQDQSKDKGDKQPDKAKTGETKTTEAAGDKIEIKWQLAKDKPLYESMMTSTTQDMKVMGMEVKQKQDQTFYFSWQLKDEDKDKNTVVTQKIEGVNLKIDVAGNTINFDSSNPTTTNSALNDFFKALVGSEFKLTLDKEMKVTKVDGREEFLKKLTQANQQMDTLLKKILSDEALKQMADPTFGIMPNKPVAKGDSWKRESDLSLGPIGSYKSVHTYTYEGQDDKNKDLAKIKVETTLTYVAPTGTEEGLPFRIKTADLKSKNAKGTVLFDIKKGRIEKSEQSLELEGNLDIEISGMSTKVELKQKQDTTVTTSDQPQLKKTTP